MTSKSVPIHRGQWWLPLSLALAATLIWLSSASCSESSRQVRKLTYPPSFSYLDGRSVRTNMGGLAVRVLRLSDLLSPSSPKPPEMQDEVARILAEMEKLAVELDPAMNKSNHPLLEKNIEALRQDIRAARTDVAADPPNYFLAGTIAGACRYCHR